MKLETDETASTLYPKFGSFLMTTFSKIYMYMLSTFDHSATRLSCKEATLNLGQHRRHSNSHTFSVFLEANLNILCVGKRIIPTKSFFFLDERSESSFVLLSLFS